MTEYVHARLFTGFLWGFRPRRCGTRPCTGANRPLFPLADVFLQGALGGTKPFRRADETILKSARATRRTRSCRSSRKAMSNAVERIVDTYVQLNDHQALEDLRTYRQRLAVHLKARANFNFSLLTGQIDAEIAVIEAGLDRLTKLSAHQSHAENRQQA